MNILENRLKLMLGANDDIAAKKSYFREKD